MSAITSMFSVSALCEFAIEMSVRAGVVLVVAVAISPCIRRCSAAKAHLFWALTLLAVLAVPVFGLLLPRIDMPFFPANARAAHVVSGAGLAVAPSAAQPDAAAGSYSAEGNPAATEPVASFWPTVVLGVWGAGSGFCLLRLLAGFVAVGHKGRTANPAVGPEWPALLQDARRRAGVTRPVRLVEGSCNEAPATWGLLRATIQLPPDASAWPESQKRVVLDHELAHVRRGDVATQFIARGVCALYWFNPLAWYAGSVLRACAEHACDDLVLEGGARASDYAQHLLTVWSSLRNGKATAFPAVAMAHAGAIEQRLKRLLDARQDRKTPSRSIKAAMLAAMAVLAVVLGTLYPTAQAESAGGQLIVAPKLDAMNPDVKAEWQTQGITTEEQIRTKLQSISVDVIQQRVKLAHIQDVIVQKLSDGKIGIEVKEPKERARVKDLVLRRGTLGFFEVALRDELLEVLKKVDQDPKFHGRLPFVVEARRSGEVTVAEANYEQVQSVVAEINKSDGFLPAGTTLMMSPKSLGAGLYLVHKQSPLSDVVAMRAAVLTTQDSPGVDFVLSDADGKRMGDLTQSLMHKPMAIVVDGVPLSAPTVQGRITARGQITGRFTIQEATDLAASITSGSLPAPLIETPAN